jgi:hypothetical protein
MRVLFIYVTELGSHLIVRILNSTGRPCLVDKFFKICYNLAVELLDILLEQFLVPGFSSLVVLVEV